MDQIIKGRIVAHNDCCLGGLQQIERIIKKSDEASVVSSRFNDGNIVSSGDVICTFSTTFNNYLKSHSQIIKTLTEFSLLATNLNKVKSLINNYATNLIIDSNNNAYTEVYRQHRVLLLQPLLQGSFYYQLQYNIDSLIISDMIGQYRKQYGRLGKVILETNAIQDFKSFSRDCNMFILFALTLDELRAINSLNRKQAILMYRACYDISKLLKVIAVGIDYIILDERFLLNYDKYFNNMSLSDQLFKIYADYTTETSTNHISQ